MPPAGVIGRGDAFLLQIADRADAVVLSNDSFQEFHGQYGWLFDQGRLVGGKPVPHVGWVFMERSPVRGPLSRKAIADAKKASKASAAPEKPSAKKAKASAEGAGSKAGGGRTAGPGRSLRRLRRPSRRRADPAVGAGDVAAAANPSRRRPPGRPRPTAALAAAGAAAAGLVRGSTRTTRPFPSSSSWPPTPSVPP